MIRKVIAIFLIFPLLSGCGPHYSHKSYPQPLDIFQQKIAVLPFSNETVDFDASPVFRYAVQNYLRYKGYKIIPNSKVDALLKEEGINEGGHLAGFSNEELCEFLNADLLLYGNITEFNTKYALIYSSIQVEGDFKLMTRDGKLLWESTSGSYSNNFTRIFFVGNVINLFMTLDVEEFMTNNDFVRLFKDDHEEIISSDYLRQNVKASSASSNIKANIDPAIGRVIMQGASTGVEIIKKSQIKRDEAVVAALIIFLVWTLLYAIFDNYHNYVVETISKGFKTFPQNTNDI